MTNLRQQIPELNPAQWKLLERTILDCLPEKIENEVITEYISKAELHDKNVWNYGIARHNEAIDLASAAITNVFNGDK